jgi:hypothetical protein
MASDGLSDVAARVLAELERQIADRGGTGSRPWRVAAPLGLDPGEMTFQTAVRELVAAGAIVVDEQTARPFGFVYLVPARFA